PRPPRPSEVGRSIWRGAPLPPIPERVLDGIPGFIAWLALLVSISSAVAFPLTLMLTAALVACYTALRFLLAGIANVMGMRRIREWEAVDWHQRYLDERGATSLEWERVHHLVIIPNYNESMKVLHRTLDSLSQQRDARRQISVLLAMEAAEPGSYQKAQSLHAQYADQFSKVHFTVHPRGLLGEMQCKSANLSWAVNRFFENVVADYGLDTDHIVVTTMDADTRWHNNHFAALTYHFATSEDRHRKFWQAPIRYHGNIWQVNPLMRIINTYASAFELAYLAAPWWMAMPMSSYSLSLSLLEQSGNWDTDVIADEWHMWIKAYFATGGHVSLQHIYLPFLADSTTGTNIIDSIRNRYSQTLRHAWGSKEVGYMLAKLIENPQIVSGNSLKLLLRIAHDILLAGAGWVILTVGSQLPVFFHPDIAPIQVQAMLEAGDKLSYLLQGLAASHPAWLMLTVSGLVMVVLVVVFQVQDYRIRPARIAPYTLAESLLELLSIPFMLVLTLFVVALPTLVAQTRLLLGIPLQFIVTDKQTD
ncbi:MAG: glycosyltransferase, partial [Chloroflexi bacterium]|nr:glycosyltransferase [Chloroflexota bacterium]